VNISSTCKTHWPSFILSSISPPSSSHSLFCFFDLIGPLRDKILQWLLCSIFLPFFNQRTVPPTLHPYRFFATISPTLLLPSFFARIRTGSIPAPAWYLHMRALLTTICLPQSPFPILSSRCPLSSVNSNLLAAGLLPHFPPPHFRLLKTSSLNF